MTRKHILAACLLFVALTLAIAGMGYRAKTDIEAVVTDQFNHQQLILAQQIAADIGDHFAFLRTCLDSLSLMWRERTASDGRPWLAIPAYYSIFAEWNVAALGVLAPGAATPVFYDAAGREIDTAGLCPEACAKVFGDGAKLGQIKLTRVYAPQTGPLAGRRLMAMTMPLADEHGTVGGLVLVVDALAVAQRYAHNVRSGQTGYAWVLDDAGYFLDHHEAEFIGRESLDVRRQRDPSIDWSRLTWLIDKRVMAGQRGMDWYVSGWHRGEIGPVKKFVAFCPVSLGGAEDPGNRWAVALAAPEDEVQGLIGRLMVREWAIVGLFEVVVFAMFVATVHLALRWSRRLREERDKAGRELLGAQEKLIRSARFAAIGEAAARLSHEIKNPLMLMGGFANQVRRHVPEDGADYEKLGIIESEAKRLETLLNEVRDFTRPAPPQIEPRDLAATVRESLAIMAGAMESRGIVVTTGFGEGLEAVPHDAARIKQVLLNLLKNAAEAMEHGGSLTVTAEIVRDRARVTVADTGGGIPEAMRARVFDPFCTTKESGTGLGLAVCQRIVEDHHGDIRFTTSEVGTTFTVELPLALSCAV
ncbi:ATP-binding protein [Solidesulfovibrio magneticus]|uniref:histidine kinase n=1 Tax=Solidesulfovibrio magneticus (strain ATCC 700980 / DSM 13731 / RS-1) TaxID=573370 RepID=C4XJR3_SOLM1|nr:ATP-binding protein [Solidesulfovibrio magneticus]BAH74268.1 putative sensor histidine kinase [Solidesulfovibrio magneticus RS-1]